MENINTTIAYAYKNIWRGLCDFASAVFDVPHKLACVKFPISSSYINL